MEWTNKLMELFQANCKEPIAYKPYLLQMEAFLQDCILTYRYVPESLRIDMYESADVRLQRAEEKLAKVQKNPAVGMQELLEAVFKNFRDWISSNQLGYLSTFELSQAGIARAKISARTHMNNSYDNEPKQEKYNRQIALLKSKGFDLYKSKLGNDFVFADTDNNRKLFEELFKPFCVQNMNFTTSNFMSKEGRTIHDYSFIVDPCCLLDINKEEPIKNGLNVDDFKELENELEKFFEAFKTAQTYPDLTNVCIGCMEGHFTYICKKLDVETEYSKAYFAQHAEERAKNQRVREIEQEIAKSSNFKYLGKFITERFQPIEEVIDKNGFYLDYFSVDCFGRATFHIKPSHLGVEKFDGFETFAPYGRMGDVEILDNEKNKKVFEKLFFLCELQGLEIKVIDGTRYIAGITYLAPNLI